MTMTGDGEAMFESATVATSVHVTSAFVDLAEGAGRVPVLRFAFSNEETGQRVDLMLDPSSMRTFRHMVSTAIDRALTAARRGR